MNVARPATNRTTFQSPKQKAKAAADKAVRDQKAWDAAKDSPRPSNSNQSQRSKDSDARDAGKAYVSALEDFLSSGVSEDLARANAVDMSGREALAQFFGADWESKSTKHGQAQAIFLGGWMAKSQLVGGQVDPNPYFKPANPRVADGKLVKYETPKGVAATPLLGCVNLKAAVKIAKSHGKAQEYEAWFCDRHAVNDAKGFDAVGREWNAFVFGQYVETDGATVVDATFWQFVQEHNLPVAITEGKKKADCLIAHGYPAIALRGVTTWHPAGIKNRLYEALGDFATVGRSVTICFDQDINPVTVANVGREIRALGLTLSRMGVDVSVAQWATTLGKGIDDAIVNHYEAGSAAACQWVARVIDGAMPLAKWERESKIPKYLQMIEAIKSLGIEPTRETEGRYLPEFPAIVAGSGLTVIEAPTGSGKTHQLAAQSAQFRAANPTGIVIWLYPLNSLGQQTAMRCDIPHTGEYFLGRDDDRARFHSDIRWRGGATLCYDSLNRLPADIYDRPVMLILDECNAGLDHLTGGATMTGKHAGLLAEFSKLAKHAAESGAVVLTEARVNKPSVDLLATLTDSEVSNYYRHSSTVDRGTVVLGTSNSGVSGGDAMLKAQELVAEGKRVLFVTASKRLGRKLDKALTDTGLRCVRIDSDTNRGTTFVKFFDNPDQWLDENMQDFDILIASPSMKSGVSITHPTAFDAVIGHFPSGSPDDALQQLARYRLPVPRFVWVGQQAGTEGDEKMSAFKIQKQLVKNLTTEKTVMGFDDVTKNDEVTLLNPEVAIAFSNFYAAKTGLVGLQKNIMSASLAASLRAEGFQVTEQYLISYPTKEDYQSSTIGDDGKKCSSPVMVAAGELKEAEIELEYLDADIFAAATPVPTVEAALRIKNSACTLEQQVSAEKRLSIEKRPTLDHNDAVAVHQWFYRGRGVMVRGVDMQTAVEYLDETKLSQREMSLDAIQNGLNYKVPKKYIKALILKNLKVLDLLLDPDAEFTNESPELIQTAKLAVAHRRDMNYYLGINVDQEYADTKGRKRHTPIEVTQKFLKKFGLKLTVIRRDGAGSRERVYQVNAIIPGREPGAKNVEKRADYQADLAATWEYRQQLLEATRAKIRSDIAAREADAPPPEPQNTDAHCPAGSRVRAWDYDNWATGTVTAHNPGQWEIALDDGWDITITEPAHVAQL